jgi:hypothetical protein
MEDIIREIMTSRLFQEGKYCWCGCGEETNIYRGKHRRFIWGHDQRGKKYPYVKSGKDSHSYKGASCKATYYYIRTQKPKPDHCDRGGILETEIDSTIKSPGTTKSKLILSNVSSKQDSKDPNDWQWLCHVCRFPRAAKWGKVSHHQRQSIRDNDYNNMILTIDHQTKI